MGERGPVPKRSSQRRRQNKESKVPVPASDPEWHTTAAAWFESLAESGQAQFYEPSDWQAARLIADELTTYLSNDRRSAMMFSHIWSAMTDLLTTEGSRRRVKLEIERDQPEADDPEAEVTQLDAYRARAS